MSVSFCLFPWRGGVRHCQFWHNIVYGRPPRVLEINHKRHVTIIFHVYLSRELSFKSKVRKWAQENIFSYYVHPAYLLRSYLYDLMYNYVQPLNGLHEILLLLTICCILLFHKSSPFTLSIM